MKRRFLKSLDAIVAFISLFVVADFLIPGELYEQEVSAVKREQQQYYNAARNQHYSYLLITPLHKFHASEEFASTVEVNETIVYSISQIFAEMNWYRSASEQRKSIYSLRIVSGLIIPLLTLVVTGIAFRTKKKIGTLVFVVQTIFLADLIYLSL